LTARVPGQLPGYMTSRGDSTSGFDLEGFLVTVQIRLRLGSTFGLRYAIWKLVSMARILEVPDNSRHDNRVSPFYSDSVVVVQ
jgi:hypothetical protein